MSDSDDYKGEGDFSMYLWLGDHDEPDRVVRADNLGPLREQAERLFQGGRYKFVGLYRWNYDTNEDDIVIEEFGF